MGHGPTGGVYLSTEPVSHRLAGKRACALLEGSGQEMIDACAVKAKPAKTRSQKRRNRD